MNYLIFIWYLYNYQFAQQAQNTDALPCKPIAEPIQDTGYLLHS